MYYIYFIYFYNAQILYIYTIEIIDIYILNYFRIKLVNKNVLLKNQVLISLKLFFWKIMMMIILMIRN